MSSTSSTRGGSSAMGATGSGTVSSKELSDQAGDRVDVNLALQQLGKDGARGGLLGGNKAGVVRIVLVELLVGAVDLLG